MLRKTEVEEKLDWLAKERLKIVVKAVVTTEDKFRDAHLESLQKAYKVELERIETENQPQKMWRKLVRLKKRRK